MAKRMKAIGRSMKSRGDFTRVIGRAQLGFHQPAEDNAEDHWRRRQVQPLQDETEDAETGGNGAVGERVAQRIDADEAEGEDHHAEESAGMHHLHEDVGGGHQEQDDQHVEHEQGDVEREDEVHLVAEQLRPGNDVVDIEHRQHRDVDSRPRRRGRAAGSCAGGA